LAPFKLMVAMLQSLKVLLKIRPAAVLGVGGFVTGPGGVMSFLLGRPLVIHEQNAIAGLTNRILSHLAQRVLEAFPSTFTKGPKVLNPGNPVRTEITSLAAPEQRFAGRDDAPIQLLVLGGSLGAKALNETLPAALAAMPDADRPIVRHQSGRRNIEEARQAYLAAGAKAEVLPFISDMAEAYSWADLVLCRAGALTVSELAAVGVGAILVPYPYAVDDHQTANARYLTEKGAARLLDQKELTPVTLCTLLKELLTGDKVQVRARLLMMAQAAKSLALPEATQRTAEQVLEVAYG
jgi:UDP-N-acetylglucosamine--N-acetylmuramyl-(pentapeptide) pyrophosphoryl-undecaprenol N-acetylglucosamine transferase